MHRRPLRRLIEIRIGIDVLDVGRLAAERRRHADHVHGHFVFAAHIDRGIERVDVVARFVGEDDDHHVAPRPGQPMVAKLFGQKADRLKDVFLAAAVVVAHRADGRLDLRQIVGRLGRQQLDARAELGDRRQQRLFAVLLERLVARLLR